MSDEAVLRLVGKLVSRATTLMFCTFPDSDRNIIKNAEQANRRTSQEIPSGRVVVPDEMKSCTARDRSYPVRDKVNRKFYLCLGISILKESLPGWFLSRTISTLPRPA